MAKNQYFKILLFSSIFMLFSCRNSAGITAVTYNTEKQMHSCQFKQYKREFILCLPDGFENWAAEERGKLSPIIMLHGAGDSAAGFKNQTHFDQDACRRNFAVIYVNGTSKTGSKGALSGWQYMDDEQSKDEVVPMKLNGSSKYNPNPAMEDVIEYFKQKSGEENTKWILLQDGRHVWPTKEFSDIDVNNSILDFFENKQVAD